MSKNKKTIDKYLDGFRSGNHEQILSCLTEDIEWNIPGVFHKTGKAEFDNEIQNEAFIGRPVITIAGMTEEDDVVVVEGSVRTQKRTGEFLMLAFCDVFVMQEARIRRLTSYLMEVKPDGV